MAFCSNCGSALPDNAASCPNCGSVVYQYVGSAENSAPVGQTQQPPQPEQPVYTQPVQPNYQQPPVQPTYQPYNQAQPQGFVPPMPNVPVMHAEQYKNSKNAKTLGILSIVFALLSPLISWILGGIGLSKANNALNFSLSLGDPALEAEAKNAKTLCTVGIILACVMFAVGLVIVFANQ